MSVYEGYIPDVAGVWDHEREVLLADVGLEAEQEPLGVRGREPHVDPLRDGRPPLTLQAGLSVKIFQIVFPSLILYYFLY